MKSQARWPSWLALAVGLFIALLSVLGCFLTLRVSNEHEHELLVSETEQAASLMKVTIGSLYAPMGSVATAATLAAHDPNAFAYLSFRVFPTPGTSIALLRREGDHFVVTAVGHRTGTVSAFAVGQVIGGSTARLIIGTFPNVQNPNSQPPPVAPTAVHRSGTGTTFGFTLGPPQTPPNEAVFEQLSVPIRFLSVNAPQFKLLNFALYGSRTADPSHLVFTNAPSLPVQGDTSQQLVSVGTRQWLAVASAKESLTGSLSRAAAWIILVLGLLIAVLVSFTLDVISRRRRYAEVQVAMRTAELAQSMSDLRDAQTALVQRERLAAIGQMASVVGHELRNPLTAVTNALYLIGAGGLPDAARPHLDLAERELGRAATLAQDLTDFVRPRTPVPEPFGLDQLLEEVMQASPPPEGISVRAHVGRLIVVADRVQTSELLTNLITNAYQAIGTGQVWVWTEPVNGRVKISVQDDGAGIDPEVAPHIFEPFVTTKTRGTGLGLAIVRRIVEEHGGTVAVEEHDGPGARIVATLPGVPEQNGPAHPSFEKATAVWGNDPAETPTGVVGTPS